MRVVQISFSLWPFQTFQQ